MPVNHRTLAQQLARTTFGVGAAMWCTASDEQKNAWNLFSTDPVRYSPLYKMNAGGIKGQNAFVALWSEVQKNNALGYGNITAPAGLTATPYVFDYDPPAQPNDGTLLGAPILGATGTVEVNQTTGNITVTTSLDMDPGLIAGKVSILVLVDVPLKQVIARRAYCRERNTR